ncbi:MAG: hypothetical protein JWO80_757 [Bryobacterales bacterium]|nr:hypothetical protein [Bryobacterales bacterium]
MKDFALLPDQRNEGETLGSPVLKVPPGLEQAREQVDRILASDTLRASESVRRLLRFLAEKAFSGEADGLKEYSIGVDALGKPASFDPRHDAGVRLLASRLRLKLDEYYANEGDADPVTIEMPRGRFKIVWKPRMRGGVPVADPPPLTSALLPLHTAPPPELRYLKRWGGLAIALMLVCIVLAAVAKWSLSRRSSTVAVDRAISESSPELEALWNPIISSRNHVVIAFWNPVFVRFQRHGSPDVLFRTDGIKDWEDEVRTPEFAGLKRLFGNAEAKPTLIYTMRGSLVSIFALSRFFASRRSDVSLSRLDELSWQQVADHDVVLVAPATQIRERQSALPVSPAFVVEKNGIRNLRPHPGERPLYDDLDDPQQSDGETVELVSMLPGPVGRTRVVSFAGNHSAGLVGGIQSLTDPAFARLVVQKLRGSSAELPPYYQMIIKVRYRGDTPTYTSYVTHRTLALKQNSSGN